MKENITNNPQEGSKTGQLTRFRIEALHSLRNIDVKITDNKLVLVGENGTGKSTVVNLICFFLTCQWHKMRNFEFKKIIAQIDGRELEVNREDLTKIDSREGLRRYPSGMVQEIERILLTNSLDDLLNDRDKLREVSQHAEIPFTILRDAVHRYSETQPQSNRLKEVEKFVKKAVPEQILYLPTYRRIEQDLQSIFPRLDLDEFRSKARDRLMRPNKRQQFIELVEFGMEDVEETIQSRLNVIKDFVRESLSNLTGTYLRDVIKGEYRTADLFSELKDIDETAIDPILSRIPSTILTESERHALRQIIQKIRRSGSVDESDKVVAHFLTQLIDLYKTQLSRETDIRKFVEVSNKYLSGKEFVYDSSDFRLFIRPIDRRDTDLRIELRMLSSGEKQIVSLFSHIYLSGQSSYFVIIDEPELSLSVPWQKRLLPDIFATQKCKGLIAVTHSPFIFENEFDSFAHSLEEFVEQTNVIS